MKDFDILDTENINIIIDEINDGTFDNSDDIFKKCNEHHQQEILDCYYVSDPPEVDDCYNCNGWYVGESRCECGNYKGYRWNADYIDFSNVLEFNITHDTPAGETVCEW